MKNWLRNIGWKILGKNYYIYLKEQHKIYLHHSKNVTMGVKTYHNGAFVWSWHKDSKLSIGKYCSIANDVNFILDCGFHLLSEVTTFPHFNHMKNKNLAIGNQSQSQFLNYICPKKQNISIGSDVWIGMNAIVLPGVTIGDGVTIMAGAVVSNDVPDYAIVGGIPSTIVRMKYDDLTIQKMKKIAWWDWAVNKVEENVGDFYMPIEEFIKKWKCT